MFCNKGSVRSIRQKRNIKDLTLTPLFVSIRSFCYIGGTIKGIIDEFLLKQKAQACWEMLFSYGYDTNLLITEEYIQ